MVRREFLKLTGLLSAVLFIQMNALGKATFLPVEVESQGKLFRGTSDGKIYVSANQGKHWQLHTNFGSEFSIFDLATDYKEQVHAQLAFTGYSFGLALDHDGKNWRTI
jgi:hypothetical protein